MAQLLLFSASFSSSTEDVTNNDSLTQLYAFDTSGSEQERFCESGVSEDIENPARSWSLQAVIT